MPAPHAPEFRRRAVELAREVDEDGNRTHPIGPLARDLKISESCLRNWMAAEDFGATLRMERDLLSRAAAFFAQENVLPRQ
jgi:transposase